MRSAIAMPGNNFARGQILVITAAALVVLLGIAALVVDLGFGVLLRRQEQNAVDPGALAAARFIDDVSGVLDPSQMDEAWEAACYYARQNSFFAAATDNGSGSTGCVPPNDSFGAVLEVVYPPDARADQFQGHHGFVQVVLTRQRDTFFGRLLGIGTLSVSTDAVAARQRGETNTHSLIALNPTDCATAKLHGNGTIQIYPVLGAPSGGYVQVNSDCGADAGDDLCGPGTGALKLDGSTVELIAPKVNVHGSCQGGDQITGVLDEAASQIWDPLEGLRFPGWVVTADGASCGVGGPPSQATGNQARGCGTSQMPWQYSPDVNCPGMTGGFDCVELQPGVYYGGWEIDSKLHVKLAPGIYVIAGGGITLKSNGELDSIQASGGLPAPVLIYNTDNPVASCPGPGAGCQQDLSLGTANSNLKLAGLLRDEACPPVSYDPDPLNPNDDGCPFGGMVIWYDGGGSQGYGGQVDIEGGGYLSISGTVYAPKAFVKLEGHANSNCDASSTQTASVQIIAWDWDIGGTGDLCMPYDPSLLYKLPLQGLVH